MNIKRLLTYVEDNIPAIIVWIVIVLAVILFAIATSGCGPSEKVQRSRALQFYATHPTELAEKCADEFPVVDSIGETIIDSIRAAVNTNLSDQIYSAWYEVEKMKAKFEADTSAMAQQYLIQIDAISKRVTELNKKYKPCVPEIRYQTQTVYKENTARVYALQADRDSIERLLIVSRDKEQTGLKETENAKEKAKNRLMWGLIASIVAAGSIVLHIKRIL